MLQDDIVPVIYSNSIEVRKRGLLSDLESIHTTDGELWVPAPSESSLLFMEALQRCIITIPERLIHRNITQNSINPIVEREVQTLEGLEKRLKTIKSEVVYIYGNNISFLSFDKDISVVTHLSMDWFQVFGIEPSKIMETVLTLGGRITREDGRIWAAMANLFGYTHDWIPAYAPWLIWLRHRNNPWNHINEEEAI